MQKTFLDPSYVLKHSGNYITWAEKNLFTLENFFQVLAILIVFLIATQISNGLIKLYKYRVSQEKRNRIKYILSVKLKNLVFFLFFSILLSLLSVGAVFFEVKSNLLLASSKIVLAWFIVRVVTSFIQSRYLSRVLAVSIWTVVTLSLFNILNRVTKVLASYSVYLGEVKISLLDVFEFIIIFSILYWVATVILRFADRAINSSRDLSSRQKVLYYKLFKFSVLFLAVLIGLQLAGIDLTTLAIFGGGIGIGIGFGLQKIFSNLISGLILLFDRSIKPGDLIALENTYGIVSGLEARYVAIITRDGKKHLIPNEKLITDKVENWSYRDNLLQLRIPVGVSYDSDLHFVKQILEGVALGNDRVLKKPEPFVFLNDFGNSSVNFELYVWIDDPMNGLLNLKSDILMSVWDKFKEHNIVIPYPHRQLIMKTDREKPLVADTSKTEDVKV